MTYTCNYYDNVLLYYTAPSPLRVRPELWHAAGSKMLCGEKIGLGVLLCGLGNDEVGRENS